MSLLSQDFLLSSNLFCSIVLLLQGVVFTNELIEKYIIKHNPLTNLREFCSKWRYRERVIVLS